MQKLTSIFFLVCLIGLTASIGEADAPGAAAPNPAKTALIGPFGGPARTAVKVYVPSAIIRTIKQYGVVGQKSEQPMDDLAKTGSVICADSGDSYLIGGTVSVTDQEPDNFWVVATITLNAFNCNDLNAPVRTITVQAESADQQRAIDIAVANVLKKYLAH